MIRDKIIFTTSGKLQELLLREDELDLNKAVKLCRAYEQSLEHVQEIRHKDVNIVQQSTARQKRTLCETKQATNQSRNHCRVITAVNSMRRKRKNALHGARDVPNVDTFIISKLNAKLTFTWSKMKMLNLKVMNSG
ncbi:hypothetical protein DPMN_147294 [Dreissena polymorpha]|uniref:Uncharacterized protein n=1 Tax=Dreissena polymorpha TaxID=45954 RepID=A0A9D4J2V6_DREPO|nr:hypothetical protein DPMN_147294 [Dreissena polymorpha]